MYVDIVRQIFIFDSHHNLIIKLASTVHPKISDLPHIQYTAAAIHYFLSVVPLLYYFSTKFRRFLEIIKSMC